MLLNHKNQLIASLGAALKAVADGRGIAVDAPIEPRLERPKSVDHGDVACNIALQIAKAWKMNPRELAQAIVDSLGSDPSYAKLIASSEIAGPGFINFRLSNAAKTEVVTAVLDQKKTFGKRAVDGSSRAMVEFVSANPTGPLHVGHGRQAALGDAIANLLSTQGVAVHREFYYNDAGVQITNLAASVHARLSGLKPGDASWPDIRPLLNARVWMTWRRFSSLRLLTCAMSRILIYVRLVFSLIATTSNPLCIPTAVWPRSLLTWGR